MTKETINRINELARKAKQSGLSDQEKAEQQALRAEYIQSIRADLEQQLGTVSMVDEKGNRTTLHRRK